MGVYFRSYLKHQRKIVPSIKGSKKYDTGILCIPCTKCHIIFPAMSWWRGSVFAFEEITVKIGCQRNIFYWWIQNPCPIVIAKFSSLIIGVSDEFILSILWY